MGTFNTSVKFQNWANMYAKHEKEEKQKNETQEVFKEFCESTSLHGYSYLFIGKGSLHICIKTSYSILRAGSSNNFEIAAFLKGSDWL